MYLFGSWVAGPQRVLKKNLAMTWYANKAAKNDVQYHIMDLFAEDMIVLQITRNGSVLWIPPCTLNPLTFKSFWAGYI